MGIFIILFFTACSHGVTPFKTALISPSDGGGNPEVHLNLCISLKNEAKTECLEKFFPKKYFLIS